MNVVTKLFCCLIALLVAGKEVVAFGHATTIGYGKSLDNYEIGHSEVWLGECEDSSDRDSSEEDGTADSTTGFKVDVTGIASLAMLHSSAIPCSGFTDFYDLHYYLSYRNLRL